MCMNASISWYSGRTQNAPYGIIFFITATTSSFSSGNSIIKPPLLCLSNCYFIPESSRVCSYSPGRFCEYFTTFIAFHLTGRVAEYSLFIFTFTPYFQKFAFTLFHENHLIMPLVQSSSWFLILSRVPVSFCIVRIQA